MKNPWPRKQLAEEQPTLPLDTSESDLPGLRAAFEACEHLRRQYTFHQALEVPALRIALKNTAEAMARRAGHPLEIRT